MLGEELFAAVSDPVLAPNTTVPKDVGIYAQSVAPTYAVHTTFKKSSASVQGVAVSDSHVFAAQANKASVHVYNRQSGKLDTMATFPERVRCLTLVDAVLVLGTAEGRLILWETFSGRCVLTRAHHVQPVTCLASTPYHLLSGSEDSNVHVWSLAQLLEKNPPSEREPERTLADHRGAVVGITLSPSINPDTSVCVTAARDRTCIVWNYRNGEAIRTILFPSSPTCLAFEPASRGLLVTCEDRAMYLVEMLGDNPILEGRRPRGSADLNPSVVQVRNPLGIADEEHGPALCISLSFDGSALLTGHTKGSIMQWPLAASKKEDDADDVGTSHPVELTNLNAAVTNLCFPKPSFFRPSKPRRVSAIVKPVQYSGQRELPYMLQLEVGMETVTRFTVAVTSGRGIPVNELDGGIFTTHAGLSPTIIVENGHEGSAQAQSERLAQLEAQNSELWRIVKEQRELQNLTFEQYLQARSGDA